MNRTEWQLLSSERSALRELLDETPAENVIDRRSLEARLAQVSHDLEHAEADTRSPARAVLTFRGKPVIGSHGIFAEFGLRATTAFTDMVTKVAAGMQRPLATSGPIPNRDQNQLLITSTARGSFGFALEEHREQPMLLADDSVVAQALAQVQQLLEGTSGDDDALADAAAGINGRAIQAARLFLELLADNDAVCAIEHGERTFAFADVAQVKRGAARLGHDYLHEEDKQFEGEFQGVLPKRRTFEFKLHGEEAVITGKIGPGVADPDALNRRLRQPMTVTLSVTRVGNGRPRYVLAVAPPE